METLGELWLNTDYGGWWVLRESLFLVAVTLTCISTHLRGRLDLRGWYFQWASILFWIPANIIWMSPTNLVFNAILLFLGIKGYRHWKSNLSLKEKQGGNHDTLP